MLDAADADALRDDIAEHGLRDQITLFDGQILDGRNRYRALMEIVKLGLVFKDSVLTEVDIAKDIPFAVDLGSGSFFRRFRGSEADALEFVLSKNLHRRHLTESQRAMVAANLATLAPGRPDTNNEPNSAHFRLSDAAKRLHVSKTSIKDARVVKDRGVSDLTDAVQRGDLKVSVAAQLARLTAEEQREVLAQHADRRALSGIARDLRAIRQKEKAERRIEREQQLGAKQCALPDKRYGVIIADPEWKYLAWSAETGSDRSPDNHYPCSDLDDIKARPVGDIAADDCALFLWVTTPFLDAGFEVMKAWGFDYKSSIVWGKLREGDGRGTGYWFLGEHETVLFGTRGKVPAPIPGQQFPSFFLAPVGEHSAKPDKVHEIAEAYFPNLPKIELNARRKRVGWDGWGNEADGGEDEKGQNSAAADRLNGDGKGGDAGECAPHVAAPCEHLGFHAGGGIHDEPATARNLRVDGGARDGRRVRGDGAARRDNSQEDQRLYAGSTAHVGVSGEHDVAGAANSPSGIVSQGHGALIPRAAAEDAPLDDAGLISVLTEACARELGVSPSLGTGNGRTASPDERRLRRAVIVAAHDQHNMSISRIGAVLGIKKQSVHEQIQAAKDEAKAIAEAALQSIGEAAE
ncbi:MT-A70 family methyltransferase [Pleomorphomonas oryzae]|uniref:MT-A70 family methyltransferase n=1 Tax=Pleomorphomonas oryzae TaxID=261934 RepID=UPI00146BC197|nr:MT-A70 family methyltransferase [Pleomorphomonas oryzae]